MKPLLVFLSLSLATLGLSLSSPVGAHILSPAETTTSTAPVLRFSDGSEVIGATARLVRNNSGFTVNLHTFELQPGAYSIWLGIYNFPQFCDFDPCGGPPEEGFPDDTKAEVQAFWVNGSGKIVGNGDNGNFSAHLTVGGPYRGEIIVNTGPGLVNPNGAEIQVILRYHGPAIPGMVREQTSTFGGGCNINSCEDVQFVIFPRP